MNFPPETFSALVPTVRRVGSVTLHPLTVRGVLKIDRAGININRRIPSEKMAEVISILSGGDCHDAGSETSFNALCKAVEDILNEAYSTYLKPQPDKNRVPGPPNGLGWPLEIVEFLCSTYGWTVEQALDCPLSTAFAFMAAFRQRHGERHGEPDYVEKIAIAEWKKQNTLKRSQEPTRVDRCR